MDIDKSYDNSSVLEKSIISTKFDSNESGIQYINSSQITIQNAVNSAIVPSVPNLSSIVTNNSSSMSTKTMDTLSLNEIKFVSF